MLKDINAGVTQGTVLGPILNTLYTTDIFRMINSAIGTAADDTCMLSLGKELEVLTTVKMFQESIKMYKQWENTTKRRITDTLILQIDSLIHH